MIEIGLIVVVCGILYRMADADRAASPILWTVLTALICLGCLAIPLPYLRMILAMVVSIALFIGYTAVRDR